MSVNILVALCVDWWQCAYTCVGIVCLCQGSFTCFSKCMSVSVLLLLLQRSTAVQVRSSVRLMPQNQPSGRGLLPSPTAWSSDQHPVAMLADVSRHTLGRTEGRGLGFGQLVCTHTGKCVKCQSSSDGHSDHSALCAGGR